MLLPLTSTHAFTAGCVSAATVIRAVTGGVVRLDWVVVAEPGAVVAGELIVTS